MKNLVYFLFFTIPSIVAAQSGCDDCYLCEWVYNSRGEKVLYHTLEAAEGLGGAFGGKEEFRRTGSYDQNCIAQLKKQKTQAEADRKEFEATKEKIKNGETVVEWYNNGKAQKSMKNSKDHYNYISWYDTDGHLKERFSNNKLVIYKNGEIQIEGPAKVRVDKDVPWMRTDTVYNYSYLLNGICTDSKKEKYVFLGGSDYTSDFSDAVKAAKTESDLNKIKAQYPFSELYDIIEKRRKEINQVEAYKVKYYQMYNEAMTIFTYDVFKKFNETYPDSTSFTMGLMKLLDPGKLTDTLSFTFSNTDKQKLKVLDDLLFKSVKDSIIWYRCKMEDRYPESAKCNVFVSKMNGVIADVQIYYQNNLLSKVNYTDGNIKNIWYKNYNCSDGKINVFYKSGIEWFKIYEFKDLIIYKDVKSEQIQSFRFVNSTKTLWGNGSEKSKTIEQFYTEAGPEVFHIFFRNFFRDNKNIKKRHEEEYYESWITRDVEFFNTLIMLSLMEKSSSGYSQSQFYCGKAIDYIKQQELSANTTQALWDFEIFKAFTIWLSNNSDETIKLIATRASETYEEKGKRVYNGTGSPTYTPDVKLKYMDEVKRLYKVLKDAEFTFPDEKETWKRIKSL